MLVPLIYCLHSRYLCGSSPVFRVQSHHLQAAACTTQYMSRKQSEHTSELRNQIIMERLYMYQEFPNELLVVYTVSHTNDT